MVIAAKSSRLDDIAGNEYDTAVMLQVNDEKSLSLSRLASDSIICFVSLDRYKWKTQVLQRDEMMLRLIQKEMMEDAKRDE